jgi:hypothetical protein
MYGRDRATCPADVRCELHQHWWLFANIRHVADVWWRAPVSAQVGGCGITIVRTYSRACCGADNVTLQLDGVLYLRVMDPYKVRRIGPGFVCHPYRSGGISLSQSGKVGMTGRLCPT